MNILNLNVFGRSNKEFWTEIFVAIEITIIVGLFLSVFYLGYFLLMLVKSRCGNSLLNGRKTDCALFVSVIVPTFNEESTIVRKLRNLMEQDYPSMEIIVIDSASHDKTVELINKYVEDNNFHVKLIKESVRRGKASALNEAFKHCSGDIVVVTDADVIWENDALKKTMLNFSDPDVGAVTGRQVLLNPDQNSATKVEKTYRSFFDILRQGESALDSTPISNGPLMAFRSKLLDPISEDTIADDSQLAVNIRKKGFRSIYDPHVVFYEYATSSFRSMFNQKVRRGQGLTQLFLREREVLFNSKYGKFGTIIFPAEFFMHIVSPILVLVFPILFMYSLLRLEVYIVSGLIFVVLLTSLGIAIFRKVNIASFLLSFIYSQLILLVSLLYSAIGKSQYKWKKIDDVRGL